MSNERKLSGTEWENALAKGAFWHLEGAWPPGPPKSASARSVDRIPASAAVKAGKSPLSSGR